MRGGGGWVELNLAGNKMTTRRANSSAIFWSTFLPLIFQVHDFPGTNVSFVFLSIWCANLQSMIFWLRQGTMMSSFAVNEKTDNIHTLMKVVLMVIHAVSIVSSQMWNFPRPASRGGHLLVAPLSPDMLNHCLLPLCYLSTVCCVLCACTVHGAAANSTVQKLNVQHAVISIGYYPEGAVFSAW